MSRAVYSIVSYGLHDSGDDILIKDMDGQVSVTNDAEAVVTELIAYMKMNVNTGRPFRIYYIDTDGACDELCHDGEHFTGFAPGPGRRMLKPA